MTLHKNLELLNLYILYSDTLQAFTKQMTGHENYKRSGILSWELGKKKFKKNSECQKLIQ